MRRFALISDIHGNLPALDAALADIETHGLGSATYCLGDLVGYGPDPAGVIERIRSLDISTIRGNYDDGVGNRRGECGCYYVTDQAKQDGAASYVFTDGAFSDEDHVWLSALPDEIRLEAEGLRVLLAHGSPRKINEYLLPDRTDAQLIRLAVQADADLVCVGHVHVPYHRAMTPRTGDASTTSARALLESRRMVTRGQAGSRLSSVRRMKFAPSLRRTMRPQLRVTATCGSEQSHIVSPTTLRRSALPCGRPAFPRRSSKRW